MDPEDPDADETIVEELSEGTRGAQLFAQHLHRMGAASTTRMIEIEGRTYRVTVEAVPRR
jgi:hypothetical protein